MKSRLSDDIPSFEQFFQVKLTHALFERKV